MNENAMLQADVLDQQGKVVAAVTRLLFVTAEASEGVLLRGLGETKADTLRIHASYRLHIVGDGLMDIAITDLDRVKGRFIYHFTVSRGASPMDGAAR